MDMFLLFGEVGKERELLVLVLLIHIQVEIEAASVGGSVECELVMVCHSQLREMFLDNRKVLRFLLDMVVHFNTSHSLTSLRFVCYGRSSSSSIS